MILGELIVVGVRVETQLSILSQAQGRELYIPTMVLRKLRKVLGGIRELLDVGSCPGDSSMNKRTRIPRGHLGFLIEPGICLAQFSSRR